MKMDNRDKLNEQEFYDLMQAYRHAPVHGPGAHDVVLNAFDDVKRWIVDNFTCRSMDANVDEPIDQAAVPATKEWKLYGARGFLRPRPPAKNG